MRVLDGVGDGESAGGTVVGDREARKCGGDGMGFGVVLGRKTRGKEVEVRAIPILDGGVGADKGEKVKAGENMRGELVGEDF